MDETKAVSLRVFIVAGEIVCLSEAAEILGLHRTTVSEVSDRLGLQYKSVPRQLKAKGLSPEDLDLIRERMKPVKRPLSLSPA